MLEVADGRMLFSRDQIVPASQASKCFGKIRRQAKDSPVFVSGRTGLETAILGFDEFEKMVLELERLRSVASPQAEGGRPLAFGEVAAAVREAAQDFSAIQKAYVFGSYARNVADGASDIDVRVELAEDGRFGLRDLVVFSKAVEQATGKDVDVVSARKIKNEALADAVERDKVLVYERQER